MVRWHRSTLRLWLAPVFILAVLGGFVASAMASGPRPFRAAQPGEPTYVLTDLKLQFPYVRSDGVTDRTRAGVGYDVAWTTDTYPGAAECELRVLDAAGNVVGSYRSEFFNLVPEVLDVPPVPVRLSAVPAAASGVQVPAAAEASCAAATPESGDYMISNPAVETTEDGGTNLVADIAVADGDEPGIGACTAVLTLASGTQTEWTFTLGASPGRMVIASLGDEAKGASVQSVTCGPYTTAAALMEGQP